MKKLRLAVTGLRQAGKTVFLTSLINFLLGNGMKDSAVFRRHGVTLRAKELPLPGEGTAQRFSYEDYIEGFKQHPPRWPQRTKELSEFHLLVHMRSRRRRTKEYRLELVDYPGEQLIDLPMVNKTYEEWSDERAIEARVGIREEMSRPYRQACEQLAESPPAEAGIKKQAAEQYRHYLLEGKRAGLHYLQPSGMLTEQSAQDERLNFCPLPRKIRERAGGAAAEYAAKYEAYKREYLTNFARVMMRCSHQVVLVDVLNILKSGVEAFNDARRCFDSILEVYRYKKRYGRLIDLLAGLLFFRVSINRVSFVATKADQATRANRNNLRALLEELVCSRHEYLRYDTAAGVGFFFAAAHRSTQDKIKEYNGRELSVLMGRHAEKGPDEERLYYPGEVPPEWPEQWDPQEQAYRFGDFLPRALPGRDGAMFDNINLDEVLWYMLGDHK
ncbi:MAG: hypothetical protein AMJ79_10555 [Phycisphaerae bacterium SM23_30]|nr:MAG: hypothetical protein AMJ79_10555 [Phycisphaerae bacterium SM23_30]